MIRRSLALLAGTALVACHEGAPVSSAESGKPSVEPVQAPILATQPTASPEEAKAPTKVAAEEGGTTVLATSPKEQCDERIRAVRETGSVGLRRVSADRDRDFECDWRVDDTDVELMEATIQKRMGADASAPRMVSKGVSHLNGRLHPEIVARVMKSRESTLRVCLEAADAPAIVRVRMVVDGAGKVSAAGTDYRVTLAEPTKECLVAAMKAIAFPKPEGGVVTLDYGVAKK